jgi:hypothetical protein
VLSRYQIIELFVIIGAILLLWGGSSLGPVSSALRNQAQSGWLESVRIDIIDGDSIRSGRQVYRLIGFNTPESGDSARCARERALAAEATRRLRELVAGGELDLRRVRCACPPGTEGTGQCNLRPAVRHAQSGWPGRRDDIDRRGPGRTIRLRSGILPAAQKLVPVLMARASEA